jgi:hypothetical protein
MMWGLAKGLGLSTRQRYRATYRNKVGLWQATMLVHSASWLVYLASLLLPGRSLTLKRTLGVPIPMSLLYIHSEQKTK